MNVPDHTLNEEDLKEKRRQRLMKAGYDARIRAKTEKDAEKLRVAEEKRLDEAARTTDPVAWLQEVRQLHEVRVLSFLRCELGGALTTITHSLQDVMLKVKDRKKNKEQLSDRKSLAAQNRMKSIANLASEAKGGKKRKRGEKGKSRLNLHL